MVDGSSVISIDEKLAKQHCGKRQLASDGITALGSSGVRNWL